MLLDYIKRILIAIANIAYKPLTIKNLKLGTAYTLPNDYAVNTNTSQQIDPKKPLTYSILSDVRVYITNSRIYTFFSKKQAATVLMLVLRNLYTFTRDFSRRTFGFSFYYLQGLCIVLFIDACLTDDEPL